MARVARRSTISCLAALAALALSGLVAPATAERWLCPDCPDQWVERPEGATDLDCPGCKMTYRTTDLVPVIAYIDSRTRDTEVTWTVQPEQCEIFRFDGLQALDEKGAVWVPWSLVDWYIPRMRLLRLKGGRELATDYPKSDIVCPKPPRFVFEVADSTSIPGQKTLVFKDQREESLAELFIVATSPEARDSARVRFIHEVETGKQPRLPRTQPRLYRAAEVRVPPAVAAPGLKAEAVVDVRVHESRGIVGEVLVQGSGNPILDQEALRAARSSLYTSGGEMGVAVPAWLRVRVTFEGTSGRLEGETAPEGFWRR